MVDKWSGVDSSFNGKFLGTVEPLNEEQAKYRLMLRDVALRGNPWCLIVSGEKGNGKTFYAQIAVNSYNWGGFRGGIYTTQPQIQAELRSDGGYGFVYKKYTQCELLVIDEISDRPNDWTDAVKTAIESILIERHRRSFQVVLIGNVSLMRMNAMFDERIKDRLKEGLIMVMNGKSLRKEYGHNS